MMHLTLIKSCFKKSFGKKSLFLLGLIFLTACQSFNLRTREDLENKRAQVSTRKDQAPTVHEHPVSSNFPTTEIAPQTVFNPSQSAPMIPALPKIGLILGAGGAKTFAHIGFLQELSKFKVPVFAIGGVEFATPMAALYANRELANDVEWQMFKLKDEEIIKKSILGSVNANNEVLSLKEFANVAFNKAKAEDFKIPFACPNYNLKKNQVYLINRGGMDQVLYFCMAYPPFYQPYLGNISAVREISALANYLRQRGANFIVLVNVLQGPSGSKPYVKDAKSTDNVLWSEIAGTYNKPIQGIDSVISIDTSDYSIMDFNKKREIMNKGAESAAQQLKVLTRKWGL